MRNTNKTIDENKKPRRAAWWRSGCKDGLLNGQGKKTHPNHYHLIQVTNLSWMEEQGGRALSPSKKRTLSSPNDQLKLFKRKGGRKTAMKQGKSEKFWQAEAHRSPAQPHWKEHDGIISMKFFRVPVNSHRTFKPIPSTWSEKKDNKNKEDLQFLFP